MSPMTKDDFDWLRAQLEEKAPDEWKWEMKRDRDGVFLQITKKSMDYYNTVVLSNRVVVGALVSHPFFGRGWRERLLKYLLDD